MTARQGIVVLSHPGGEARTRAVHEIVAHVDTQVPCVVAWAVRDAAPIARSVAALYDRGIREVAIVRLLLSPHSFSSALRSVFGVPMNTPQSFAPGGTLRRELADKADGLVLRTHGQGLVDADEVVAVMRDRIQEGLAGRASHDVAVIVLAHGMASDDDDHDLKERMDHLVRQTGLMEGLGGLWVGSLREDWPQKREIAESEVRAFAHRHLAAGRAVHVVPFRVFGSGPYEDVFRGLDVTLGAGLIPDARVATWVLETAAELFA